MRHFILLSGLVAALSPAVVLADEPPPAALSVHAQALLDHKDHPTHPDLIGDPALRGTIAPLAPRSAGPCGRVFGYLPYWESAANIHWDSITHLAAFSVEVNPDGTLGNDHGWPWTSTVNTAHAHGVKVVLAATLFDTSELLTLVSTPAYRDAFFVNMKNKMLEGTTDGINIDFEGSGAYLAYVNDFMADLTAYMHAEVPGSEVTFASPAVDWSGDWNLPGLAASCDGLFIMGYAFAGSWSTTSGPNAPLTSTGISITRTILDEYFPVTQTNPERLMLGVPYYGGHWITSTSSARSAVVSWQGSTFYASAQAGALTHGRLWDAASQTPWYRYQVGSAWHQVWYDDAESLGLKYALARDNRLGGIGMWALDYDDTRPELWAALGDHLAQVCCGDAAPAAEVFADSFDDGAAAGRWDVFTSSTDHTVDFAFNYATRGLPPAPNSTGGSTTGLKITVNKNDATPSTDAVSLYPRIDALSGHHALKFDMWIHYNGPPGGGIGSTEYMTAGLLHAGTRVVWPSNPASDGHWFAVDGEGGAADDYRAYSGAAIHAATSGVYAAASRAADASMYQVLLRSPAFETQGAPGKQWVEVEVRRTDFGLEWLINGYRYAVIPDPSGTAGRPMIGYMDVFTSLANPAADNFIVFDNIRVEQLAEADCNASGVEDACETLIPGDYNADGQRNALDAEGLTACLAGPGAVPSPDRLGCTGLCQTVFDLDHDGDVDLRDAITFSQLVN